MPYDILFPRRFSDISTNGSALRTVEKEICSAFADKFITTVEKNHLYMEQSLQTSYTAAFYFLFQNAVQQKSRNITEAEANLLSDLAFTGNEQLTNVHMSIPLTNVVISPVGCFLLFVTSLSVVLRAKRSERVLRERANADIVMEAMVDSSKYPRSLIKIELNQVADAEEEANVQVPLHELRVQRVVL